MYEFIDKTSEKPGTPINRKSMMAIQGFDARSIEFTDDGSIVEINSKGHIKTTSFMPNGNIKEVFSGEKVITKTTIFNDDGSISEEIS